LSQTFPPSPKFLILYFQKISDIILLGSSGGLQICTSIPHAIYQHLCTKKPYIMLDLANASHEMLTCHVTHDISSTTATASKLVHYFFIIIFQQTHFT